MVVSNYKHMLCIAKLVASDKSCNSYQMKRREADSFTIASYNGALWDVKL